MKSLSAKTLEDAITARPDDDYARRLHPRTSERSAAARQATQYFVFAFTAAQNTRTLQVFGEKDEEGKPKPFHLYSIRQAIEEGFILDVLKQYTTYEGIFQTHQGH